MADLRTRQKQNQDKPTEWVRENEKRKSLWWRERREKEISFRRSAPRTHVIDKQSARAEQEAVSATWLNHSLNIMSPEPGAAKKREEESAAGAGWRAHNKAERRVVIEVSPINIIGAEARGNELLSSEWCALCATPPLYLAHCFIASRLSHGRNLSPSTRARGFFCPLCAKRALRPAQIKSGEGARRKNCFSGAWCRTLFRGYKQWFGQERQCFLQQLKQKAPALYAQFGVFSGWWQNHYFYDLRCQIKANKLSLNVQSLIVKISWQ